MVQDRKRYYVSPGQGGWVVTHQGAVVSAHRTKEEAIQSGRRVAKMNEPSQLLVQKANGQYQEERTYQDDPYPPRG